MNKRNKSSKPVYNIKNVSYGYNDQANVIEGINLKIQPGESIAIVGPSGCGKSTMLKLVAGIIVPSSGEIDAINSITIGFAPQSPTLLPWHSVKENVLFKNKIHNDAIDEEESLSVLKHLGIYEKKDCMPNNLSGGEQSRTSIARAIAGKPDIVLLDEPFSHLDDITAGSIIGVLDKYIKQNNIAALFVSHNIRQAIQLADKVIVLGGSPAKVLGEVSIIKNSREGDLSEATILTTTNKIHQLLIKEAKG